MKKIISTLSFVFFSLSLQAQSGWDSGGGKIMKYEGNPWFLTNTKTVKYCIQSDTENFGVEPSILSETVRASLRDWTSILGSEKHRSYSIIGTQNFIETSCDDFVQMHFQFGFLTEEQKEKYFFDPTDFIARTVRTQYNKQHLTSKGFIYIAPLRGPLAPKSLKHLDENAWTIVDGKILRTVINHELGHVFGIPHDKFGLMQAAVPEYLVSKRFVQLLKESNEFSIKKLLRIYSPKAIFDTREHAHSFGCGENKPIHNIELFGLSSDTQCVKISIDLYGDLSLYQLQLYAGDSLESLELVGKAEFNHTPSSSLDLSWVTLPPEQTVFDVEKEDGEPGFISTMIATLERTSHGTLKFVNNEQTLPLYIRSRQPTQFNDIEVMVFKNGKFYENQVNFR